jgi:hypothetical protein
MAEAVQAMAVAVQAMVGVVAEAVLAMAVEVVVVVTIAATDHTKRYAESYQCLAHTCISSSDDFDTYRKASTSI